VALGRQASLGYLLAFDQECQIEIYEEYLSGIQ
jgi:hypothetical protein